MTVLILMVVPPNYMPVWSPIIPNYLHCKKWSVYSTPNHLHTYSVKAHLQPVVCTAHQIASVHNYWCDMHTGITTAVYIAHFYKIMYFCNVCPVHSTELTMCICHTNQTSVHDTLPFQEWSVHCTLRASVPSTPPQTLQYCTLKKIPKCVEHSIAIECEL